ncbi:hypothetical protein COOONC_06760 [Cooperia oncophora]
MAFIVPLAVAGPLRKFTFQNDVWAYGVVLWELTTRGLTPYSGKNGLEILDFLRADKRLEMPEYCPAQLYTQVMLPCWHADPNCRPNFSKVLVLVNNLITWMENSQSNRLYMSYKKICLLVICPFLLALNDSVQGHSALRRVK